MSSASVQMSIDNRWVPCQPAEGFGVLGVRYLCDLGGRGAQAKRLLVRPVVWPQASGQAVGLTARPGQQFGNLGLRSPSAKIYNQVLTQPNRQQHQEPCQVLQQDVSGLVPLRVTVHQAARAGDARRIRQLFFRCCKTLEKFGKLAAAGGRGVPLQCPPSLAVEENGSAVVPLDAELQATGPHPEATGACVKWFGKAHAGGVAADARQAGRLHARAVFQYFRELLANAPPDAPPLPAGLFPPVDGDTTFEEPDWERWFAEEAEAAAEQQRGGRVVAVVPTRPKGTWTGFFLRASLLLNALLVAILLFMLLIWPRVVAAVGSVTGGGGAGDSSLLFSTYCVVFPTEGTVGNKVNTSVQELFPGRVQEVRPGGGDHEKLRRDRLAAVLKSVAEPQKLTDLLGKLGADHAVRFKGFAVGPPVEALPPVIERAGIFSLGGSSREQHGSLLQPNGLEKVLTHAGLGSQGEPRALLEALKKAIVEYASLVDALKIVDRRHAFLLQVEPTAAAHEEVRRKLVSRLDNPVFISRPVTELFDAVDPTEDEGVGAATYTLKLDQPCYWRPAGTKDRDDVNYAAVTDKEQLKWTLFPAGKAINWNPVLLPRRSGGADNVVTFDIAVLLDDQKPKGRVVVFRNQKLLLGQRQEQVLTLSKDYIESGLKLKFATREDAVRVRRQGQQFTATLLYSFLAEMVPPDTNLPDVRYLSLEEFQRLRAGEDNF